MDTNEAALLETAREMYGALLSVRQWLAGNRDIGAAGWEPLDRIDAVLAKPRPALPKWALRPND